jgi:hypothetical protein
VSKSPLLVSVQCWLGWQGCTPFLPFFPPSGAGMLLYVSFK